LCPKGEVKEDRPSFTSLDALVGGPRSPHYDNQSSTVQAKTEESSMPATENEQISPNTMD